MARRRDVAKHGFGLQLGVEGYARPPFGNPGNPPADRQVVLAEDELLTWPGNPLTFDQGSVGGQVAQRDLSRAHGRLEAGGHQHVRPPRATILTDAALVHGGRCPPTGKIDFCRHAAISDETGKYSAKYSVFRAVIT